jgi:heme/copper-type cytochrome/quinol oxidase subunit 3
MSTVTNVTSWDARARARLGMGMFLIALGVLFALLLIAFVSFRDPALAARSLNPALGVALTASLVLSACAVWRAEKGNARLWLIIAIMGGVGFIAIQCGDFARLISSHVTAASSLFGTTWFTLAGMHALSVLCGVLLLAILFAVERREAALSAAALYWYFVSAVWILIFGVAYLWSFL